MHACAWEGGDKIGVGGGGGGGFAVGHRGRGMGTGQTGVWLHENDLRVSPPHQEMKHF